MYNLDEYHSSRSYCAEQFQQKIYFVCLMTAMQLCEIWGVYSGEKAYCRRVMKPYSLVGRYQHFKVTCHQRCVPPKWWYSHIVTTQNELST